jgi:spermidine/putrescine transport system ATP-binding protein
MTAPAPVASENRRDDSAKSSGAAPASAPADADLHLTGLTKRFGSFTAVEDLHLTVPTGSFFALLGPSGCGKTTTLRMIAGLERPTAGTIAIGSQDITETKPYRRQVNTVFQSYALFPHLDVFENVAFGLRRRHSKAVKAEVETALELVQLGALSRRKPSQLSGGQQQRVALARAIVNRPAVLLLDEPLGALDLKMRRQMQVELKRIQTEVGLTFIHVTHDQEEAMTMADTIAVMNAGQVEQLGGPAELYERPRTTFAANFLGQSNLLAATVTGRSGATLQLDVHGRRLVLPVDRAACMSGALWLGVRPEKLRVSGTAIELSGSGAGPDPGTGERAENALQGTVTDTSFTGVATSYLVRLPWGQEVTVVQQNDGSPLRRPGDEVTLTWSAGHAFGLDADQDAHAGEEEPVAESVPSGRSPVPGPAVSGESVTSGGKAL